MAKILLVEDDAAIREGLEFAFAQTQNELITVKNIKEAKAMADSASLSLVLLDVSLPDGNGFEFYQSRLKDKEIPTIFLTARDDENDIVRGLNLGAEDYITKPFSIKELMARANRVLIRQQKSNVIKVEDISFDLDKLEAKKGDEIIVFSSLELKILKLLFDNVNRAVSKDAVIDCIWQATGNDVYDHTVTVYIKRIRDKLGANVIKTVKGVGYRIDTKG